MHSPDQPDRALDEIDFDLDIEDPGEEADALTVHVVPMINGLPFLMGWRSTPFEFLEMMAIGAQAARAWPFNCECGMPQCAGFHNPMKIDVDDQSVSWHLPTELVSALSFSRKVQSATHRLRFDSAQYLAAFRRTFQRLEELERQHGRLCLGVIDSAHGSLEWGLRRETNWAEMRRIRSEILRDFDEEGWLFVLQTQTGLQLTIELETVIEYRLDALRSGALYDHGLCSESLISLVNQLLLDPALALRDLDPEILARNAGPVLPPKEFDPQRVLRQHGLDPSEKSWEPWLELGRTATVTLRRVHAS